MYAPETSFMKRTSVQFSNREVRDLAMALRAEKVSGVFKNGPQAENIFFSADFRLKMFL